MTLAQQIIKTIQDSIDDFNDAIPGMQKKLYRDLVGELQKLETREGKLLSSVSNLKLIGNVRISWSR